MAAHRSISCRRTPGNVGALSELYAPCSATSACAPVCSSGRLIVRDSNGSVGTWPSRSGIRTPRTTRRRQASLSAGHRRRDGSSAIVLEPRELLARLAAQVTTPGGHRVRYHGVLAPASAWRPYVVPASDQTGDSSHCNRGGANVPRWKRTAWSELLRRVFAVDALICDHCSGQMRVMATIR